MGVVAPRISSDTVAQARGLLNTLTADSLKSKVLTYLGTQETFPLPPRLNMEDKLGYEVKLPGKLELNQAKGQGQGILVGQLT